MKIPFRWAWSYEQISADNQAHDSLESHDQDTKVDFDSLAQHPERSTTRLSKSASVLVLSIILASALVLVVLVSLVASRKAHQNTLAHKGTRHCGNSSAEAVSLGCTWDQLSWSWLPPGCPHYANEEFMRAEDWKYYTDPLGKQEAIGALWTHALDNHVELYGERREHLTHCVYMFLSLGQIIRDGTPYHQRISSYEHVHHCSGILLEALRQDPNWHNMETSTGRVSYEEHC